MAANSPEEQLMLELINRARMYPAAEAARQGISLNQGLAPGTISTAPKQVLAMNDFLVLSADRHSNWMLINDQFNHQESPSFPSGRTGLDPDDRMAAAGYVFAGPSIASGENISWTGVLPGPINLTASIISQHRDLFLSAGHRLNILADDFQEIGIGQQHGFFLQSGTNYDASMITQNFALSGSKVFVTGVVYNDTVNDNFFTVGEQTVGRSISGTGGITDVTGGGGGYELAFTAGGAKAVTFDLATGAVGVAVTLGATNIKVDVVNGREVWTNASLAVTTTNVTEIHALGIQSIGLTGTTTSEKLFGNPGTNMLDGGGGNDTLDGSVGADTMFGRTGSDTYVVDNAGDKVNETGGDGVDSVVSSVSFNFSNVAQTVGTFENLTLSGSGAIYGIGNAVANILTGNTAANPLNGVAGNDIIRGGSGNDTVTGGAGNDVFWFNSAPNISTNRDIVTDFVHGVDKFWMENAIYTKLGAAGALNPAFFRAGSVALDANDYIIYNHATGVLAYDANGSAAGAAIQFAVLTNKPLLTASDFAVV